MAYGIVNVGQPEQETSNFVTTDQVGVPGGVATLDASGKLTASQRPDNAGYSKSEVDSLVSQVVSTHNASTSAHSDLRGTMAELEAAVHAIDLKYGTDVSENAFAVTFATLDNVVVSGVWNTSQARIEF